MSDFASKADVLRALADGRIIAHHDFLVRYGFNNDAGFEISYDRVDWFLAPVALRRPVSEYRLYKEPNPHPFGTYRWAREEHARGMNVWCSSVSVSHNIPWGGCKFSDAEIENTNWASAKPASRR